MGRNFWKETSLMNGLLIISILFVIILALWVSLNPFRDENKTRSTVISDDFSVDQSVKYWEYLTQEPRGIGSVGHERSKYYLISRLQERGLVVELQAIDGLEGRKIENIIARIPGTNPTGTILLTTPYDSSEGKVSGGATVAALLETIRVITTTQPLKNHIVVLFSDGNDLNFAGTKAFSEYHRFIDDIDIVINFETKNGTSTSLLLESNARNEQLMAHLLEMTSPLMTHSFLGDIHKILPKETELSVYEEHGMGGLTFSFLEENLLESASITSLSYQGNHMLEIVRHFGNGEIGNPTEEQVVYFNLFGKKIITYNEKFVTPLMEFAIFLFIGTIIHGLKKKQFTFKGIMVGMILFICILPLAYFTGEAVKKFVTLVMRGELLQINLSNLLLLSIGLIILSTMIWIYSFFLKSYKGIDLTLGSFIGWLVLVIISSTYFKGSSYIFLWPFLIGIIGLNGLILLKKKSNIQQQALSIAIVFLTLVFTLPIFYLLYMLITLEFAGVLAICFSLIIVYMIPALSHIDKKYMPVLSMIFLFFGIGSFIIHLTMNIL